MDASKRVDDDDYVALDAAASSTTTAGTRVTTSRVRPRVLYLVDADGAAMAAAKMYTEHHMMRLSRVQCTHALVHSLGLDDALTVATARRACASELCVFHRAAYVACLRAAPRICGDPLEPAALSFQKEFDVPAGSTSSDCPLFAHVWPMVASQAGASLACADALLRGDADVAINWAGGMHHAAAAHASGFCFVNDAVLCLRRLLRRFQRVLYVDLDVHHGDGVEAAFRGNARVLTVSLHQYGDGFFPGTGGYAQDDDDDVLHASSNNNDGCCCCGCADGECGAASATAPVASASSSSSASASGRFAVNVPLPPRTGDAAYVLSFRVVLTAAVRCYDPEAVVVQCGADTIAGDLIGRLCVTTVAHTQCVADIVALGLPTVLLGGGGYHVYHTAQCWAIHTATALGRTSAQLPCYIPRHDPYYAEYRKACVPLRPTLHVLLDDDVDRPLSLAESLPHVWRLCASVHAQMRAARLLRQHFLRTVMTAVQQHRDRVATRHGLAARKQRRHSKAVATTTMTAAAAAARVGNSPSATSPVADVVSPSSSRDTTARRQRDAQRHRARQQQQRHDKQDSRPVAQRV